MNIGNPQAVGQGYITYNREIISSMLYPDLLNKGVLSADATETAKMVLG
jgi:hypothetical protein